MGQGILFEVTYLYKYENSSLWLNTLWTSIFFKYWGVTCRPPVNTKTLWTCMRTSLIFLKVINVSIYCKNMTSFVNYLMLFHDRWILPRIDNEMGRFIPKDNPWPHDHMGEEYKALGKSQGYKKGLHWSPADTWESMTTCPYVRRKQSPGEIPGL